MNNKRISLFIFLGMILLYGILAGLTVFLPQGAAVSTVPAQMPASLPMMALLGGGIALVAYGALGVLGLFLARKLGLPEIWDAHVTNRQRFVIPALAGLAV